VPAGLSNIVAITAGATHNLVLRADGRVVAWGNNANNKTNVPATLSNVVAIAAGANHSLALQADGTLVGWGYSGFGLTNQPAAVSNVFAIASGGNHNAVLAPNRPPTATPQTASGPANHDRVITLTGTDPDLDPLGSVVTTLPSQGELYQFAGGARGPRIGAPGIFVQDGTNRVIFVPATNAFGSPYTSFSFAVSDGTLSSAPVVLTVHVAPLVVPTISNSSIGTNGSFQVTFTGDSHTSYCVWASTNLVSWQFMGPANATQPGLFQYVDPAAAILPKAFYRISTDCENSTP
jgi:hypothetical protein